MEFKIMDYKEYTVKVYGNGSKSWYLNDEYLTEEEFNKRMSLASCDGKIVEIDGKKYRLVEEVE